ncbi:TniQ family protein [Chitinimonas viridis]|uniref:TniQ family protein n=1 Tax=Chitinimonas viridis TaxID=664880 RepID=A0ABT8B414_9NEIS|nr:TniQ family protein [Chitinimonas viridis]MDN3576391.1 TniQ family protein [Chitinimonas viridis]
MSGASGDLPTRLFSLAPIAVGTAAGESLLSYLVRLARAHSMSPRQLIRTEILPLADLGGGPACGRFYADQARTMAGVGKYACAFVHALQALTGRDGLAHLTMLPWAGVVPAVGFGLVAERAQWCPECLVSQRQAREDSHFLLAWSLDCYQACPRHRRRLASACPWCGRAQHAVPDYPDQHRCTQCRGYLGSELVHQGADEVPTERQLLRAMLIENMLDYATDAETWATHANLCRRLSALADAWTEGGKRALSLRLGFTKTSVSTWVAKKQRPVFPQLLQLCDATGLSVRELLGECGGKQPPIMPVLASVAIKRREAASAIAQHNTEAELGLLMAGTDSPPSAAAAAAKVGVTVSQLRYRHRATMAKLSEKHRAHRHAQSNRRWSERVRTVQVVALGIAADGQRPSIRRVTERLRHLRLSLQNPRLRAAYRRVRSEIADQ